MWTVKEVVVVVAIIISIIIIHFLSALVPDSVKKELLQKIKAYLVQDMWLLVLKNSLRTEYTLNCLKKCR